MSDMIERVSAAIYQSLMGMREISTDTLARAAIEAITIDKMIVDAYVRGVEWNEENPLDHEYRFKAAFDYADKLLSQDTLHSSSSAEPPRVADAQAGGDHGPSHGASPSAAQFPE